ncbi:glycogen synthase [Mycolicibacterium sp.]|uniref:glycogen synthase n=1 Tax=Mycolicibacterium sp. TaxID=2320850 RepID=UPI001A2B5CCC|nr:glycogen synthase [Mycolicibacterium sp.]MBJ7338068.1 glycogen synthase [Mycolicibacterium sp.]
MRVAMMTREYPPEVYGGAGVHVTELVAQLKTMCEVDVHCMGAARPDQPDVFVAQPDPKLDGANAALTTLSADLVMVNAAAGATVAHSHTWYAGMAGHLAAMLYGIPHVLTAHSLEPMRPWKAEQLGGGYRVSSWVERTAVEAADAVIAVSSGMRDDVLAAYPALDPERVHVVRNGIDTEKWYPVEPGSTLERIGVDPSRPIVAFVGRITRQKGVAHLVAAAHRFAPDVQLVLCAGAPDTPEIAAEVGGAVEQLASSRSGIFWVQEMLPGDQIREILSAATVFVCPSVYEPLGIVNLEAMACSTAVVASDVGGIPEVVNDGETGVLVHYDPADATGFETELANAVNALVADPDRAARYGSAGRQRCIDEFSWARIAEQTLEIYQKVSS